MHPLTKVEIRSGSLELQVIQRSAHQAMCVEQNKCYQKDTSYGRLRHSREIKMLERFRELKIDCLVEELKIDLSPNLENRGVATDGSLILFDSSKYSNNQNGS